MIFGLQIFIQFRCCDWFPIYFQNLVSFLDTSIKNQQNGKLVSLNIPRSFVAVSSKIWVTVLFSITKVSKSFRVNEIFSIHENFFPKLGGLQWGVYSEVQWLFHIQSPLISDPYLTIANEYRSPTLKISEKLRMYKFYTFREPPIS